MTYQIGESLGVPFWEDSAAPGVPVTSLPKEGGELLARLAVEVLANRDRVYDVRDEGAVADGTTDDTIAIRNAIERVYALGGGIVNIPPAVCMVSEQIDIPERVVVWGCTPGWESSGSVSKASSVALFPDAVLTNAQGIFRLVYRGSDASGARHNGGIRDLTINGSYDSVSNPTPVNHGVILYGVRYAEISRVHLIRCGGSGLNMLSNGAVSPNGIQMHGCVSNWNGVHGYIIGGGDNLVNHCIGGTNGLDGFSCAAGGTVFTNCLSYNNLRDGFGEGGVSAGNIYGSCLSYDNEKSGFVCYAGSSRIVFNGCVATDNGRNLHAVYPSAVDRAGFWFASGGTYDTVQINGGFSGSRFATTQEYGVSLRSATGRLQINGLACVGNNTSAQFVQPGGLYLSRPFADNQVLFGEHSNRFARFASVAFHVVQANTDSQPRIRIDASGVALGPAGSTAPDIQLQRAANDTLGLAAGDSFQLASGYVEAGEIADPTAPAADRARLYVRDNGFGKTQLVVRFPTGAIQVLATEP